MKSSTSFRFSSVFFFFFILFIVAAIADEEYSNIAEVEEEDSTDTYLQPVQCRYSISVKTGTDRNAGTNSTISLILSNRGGSSVRIPNLRRWGVMRPGHIYFQRGNLDLFVVNGPCLPSRVCRITVTSDGTGNNPAWNLDFVAITTTGPNRPIARINFRVNQWLSRIFPPFQLSTTRNLCRAVSQGAGEEGLDIAEVNTDFVVPTWE